jgi:2-polyprenyl-3-methyl-5-hydroxy-6-metoxy-1,4-benzoquinol methylase
MAGAGEWFTRAPISVVRSKVEFLGVERDSEVLNYIDGAHYAGSFGTQWSRYRHVQIDRFNGSQASYRHLMVFTLGNPELLRGKTILEIGSGAGRFTDYLVDLGSTVITVDPSAIDTNVALGAPNLIAVRADLFDVPIRREKVDVVFCRGVIQHTCDPRRAILRLFDYVRPGGLVLFDVYALKWYTPFCAKYWLRPFTRRIPAEKFIPFAERWVPRLLRFKRNFISSWLPGGRVGGHIGNQLVPIADFSAADELGSEARRTEWSVLDTIDMYTPRFDRPMTWRGVMTALHESGARDIKGDRGSFCFQATAPLR